MNVLKPHLKSTVVTLFTACLAARDPSPDWHRPQDDPQIRSACRPRRPAADSNSPSLATGSSSGAEAKFPHPGHRLRLPTEKAPTAAGHARSSCEPHREWIEAQVRLGRNAQAIYQELVDTFGFARATTA